METKKKVAIKIMREQSITCESSLELFINEVKILSQVTPNDNIVQLQRCCLSGKYTKCDGREFAVLYYVMKVAENGELFKFLMHTPKFEEDLARFFFKQIMESIEYLHEKGITHRDIKPENILIDRKLKIKLCDFGFSAKTRNDKGQFILFNPSDPVGSPEYNPPEVTQKQYADIKYNAEPMDLFSSGCVLFMMVMSSAPFGNTSTSDRYYSRFCMENKTNFWKIFAYNNKPTNEFKDLIHSMLEADPQKRITIAQIKQHPWMNGPIPSIEQIQEQMNERICIVFNKTLEELRQKLETKGLSKKEKPQNRPLSNIEGLKIKYHKQIHDMNQQNLRKIQNVKKQKILMKQAQPELKQNIPHPQEECLLKQNEDYIIEFPAQSLFLKEKPVLQKNSPNLHKSISGNLEESKSDSQPAHVEQDEYHVAPIKKYSWQSKDDSFFSTNNKPQNNAAVQFNNEQQILNQLKLDTTNTLTPPQNPLLQNLATADEEFSTIQNNMINNQYNPLENNQTMINLSKKQHSPKNPQKQLKQVNSGQLNIINQSQTSKRQSTHNGKSLSS